MSSRYISSRLAQYNAKRAKTYGTSEGARIKQRAIGSAKHAYRVQQFRRSMGAAAPALLRGPSGEVKSFDWNWGETALQEIATTAGNANNDLTNGMICLNLMTMGTTFYNRIGAKVSMVSARLTFDLALPSIIASDFQSNEVRYLIIYDRQTNAAWPSITDVLRTNDTATTHASSINIANRDRFAVLRDQVVTLDTSQALCTHVDCFMKLPQLQTQYKSSTAGNLTIGDINTGALYLIIFEDTLSATVDHVNITNVASRIRYLD